MDRVNKIKEMLEKTMKYGYSYNQDPKVLKMTKTSVTFLKDGLPHNPEAGIPAISCTNGYYFYKNGLLHNALGPAVVTNKYVKYYIKGQELDKNAIDSHHGLLTVDEILERKHELDIKAILSRRYLSNPDLLKLLNSLYDEALAQKVYETCKK